MYKKSNFKNDNQIIYYIKILFLNPKEQRLMIDIHFISNILKDIIKYLKLNFIKVKMNIIVMKMINLLMFFSFLMKNMMLKCSSPSF